MAIKEPKSAQAFLKLERGHVPHEFFAVIGLNNSHRLIAFETLFRGKIDGVKYTPRKEAKAALEKIQCLALWQGHPSGLAQPS